MSLTTKRTGSDTTVVLQAGDHRFIKHDTVVNYADARQFPKDDLISRIEQRFFAIDDIFPEAKLKVMQQGLFNSPFTSRAIKKSCAGVIGDDNSDENAAPPPPDS